MLIGVTERNVPEDVSSLLSSTGVNLLMSNVLRSRYSDPLEQVKAIQLLYSSHNQTQLAWTLGERDQGHLASLVDLDLVKMYELLLFTLPGTPVFNYGDEICLMDTVRTRSFGPGAVFWPTSRGSQSQYIHFIRMKDPNEN